MVILILQTRKQAKSGLFFYVLPKKSCKKIEPIGKHGLYDLLLKIYEILDIIMS